MDLLRLNDLTSPNLHKLIDRAVEMEHEFRTGTLRPTLTGKRIALIVDDSGWRNTTALDLGMRLLLPLSLVQIYPREYWVSRASYPRSSIEQTEDMDALRYADVIVTDCWPNGGSKEVLLPFQITARLLDRAKAGCVFIPCPG